MGLDMYLSAQINSYRSYGSEPDAERAAMEKAASELGLPASANIDFIKIEREVAYWRKANQIHRWFVENVQEGNDDCGNYYVERDQLVQLRDLCDSLLANRDNKEALEKLPPRSGFFFGGTEVDEYYWSDLESTVEQINRALADVSEKAEFYYHSSW